jgi:hypothetical protein
MATANTIEKTKHINSLRDRFIVFLIIASEKNR